MYGHRKSPKRWNERFANEAIKLNNKFKMKIIGDPDTFLGMKIIRQRERRILKLVQQDYIKKILSSFNMKNCNSKDTPMITRQAQNQKEIRRCTKTYKSTLSRCDRQSDVFSRNNKTRYRIRCKQTS